jgi:hypothetical protein
LFFAAAAIVLRANRFRTVTGCTAHAHFDHSANPCPPLNVLVVRRTRAHGREVERP